MTVPFPNTYWEPERQEQKEADLHLSVKNWWKSFNLFFQIKKALGEESLWKLHVSLPNPPAIIFILITVILFKIVSVVSRIL